MAVAKPETMATLQPPLVCASACTNSTVSAPSRNTDRNASAATATPVRLASAWSALVRRKPCQAFGSCRSSSQPLT